MLWHLEIQSAPNHPDSDGPRIAQDALESGLSGPWRIVASRGFLVEGDLTAEDLERAAQQVLTDPIVETFRVRPCPAQEPKTETIVHVAPKPGVTDAAGESALSLLRDLGHAVKAVRSIRTHRIEGPADQLPGLIQRVLANEAVEQAFQGEIPLDHLVAGGEYKFKLITRPIRAMSDEELIEASREGNLALNLVEMQTIQKHFADLGRDPTDCELETLAQTWSEHCSHKTLRGRIDFDGKVYENLLKETVFAATQKLSLDWLVSVFVDNAGVVRFDDDHDVCFKVETHNHPSAIDPYGGAHTGLGGVIRDALGTGLGSKPICNTSVFCVASPEFPPDQLPTGVLHPKRVLKGVIAGAADYGNRMGVPTVNGALAVDPGYLSNPLVFCGTVGVLPRGKAFKSVEHGDRIVAIGGRTGRDGIHGATISSIELSSDSEALDGGSVQIGDAITEKMVLDVILQARDRGLFRSVTDCGAGGFSSAVGEMGAELGAVVDLDRAPLKYPGLSYTEIWISEAQERMVLAVPPENWEEFHDLCVQEGVEATDLGEFVDTGRLELRYQGQQVGDLSMEFLHDGIPRVTRSATFPAQTPAPIAPPASADFTADLRAILGHWDVCSKEWAIRQHDHEVQARTVVKPLVGEVSSGPGDAAVILPVVDSRRGLVVSCGLNPRYGKTDPYNMAACAIDEAIRNCVAVGADPDRIALLDNFCWGNPERPETLGSLVLAAQACHDYAIDYAAPFISGKDSLYNEYSHNGQSLAIPPTLLISAIGQTPDVRRCVTMDFKAPGNEIILLGTTNAEELGGSLWTEIRGIEGGSVPKVDAKLGRAIFRAVFQAIQKGLIRSCHDLSEGGLAVALAEMAFAGRIGAEISLAETPRGGGAENDAALLFSESQSRFLLEVEPQNFDALSSVLKDLPFGRLGQTQAADGDEPARLTIRGLDGSPVVDSTLAELEEAWSRPLRW